MSKSIIIDPGHGGTDPGAIGFGVREKEWNLRISLYQYNRLKELGAKVAITRTTDETLDSVPRTNKIRGKYDYCISNHWNAFNGAARGVETIYNFNFSKKFATDLANALVRASGIPLRRVFERKNEYGTNYYFMHRLTTGVNTVIVEYGFLDNVTDHNWYKNESNFIKAAEAVVEVICKEIGIAYRPKGQANPPVSSAPAAKPLLGTIYKVQAGAFSSKANADKLHETMESAGIDAFVIQEGKLFKVQAGAYSIRANAEVQLKKITNLVGAGFIVESGTAKPIAAVPKPNPKPALKSIDAIANEIIAGKGNWGNGQTRKDRLTEAGYDAATVQSKIDEILKPKAKKEYVQLAAHESSWRVYPLNKQPVVNNESGFLNPKLFGGIEYEVLGYLDNGNTAIIQTRDFGKVKIFIKDPSAKIVTR